MLQSICNEVKQKSIKKDKQYQIKYLICCDDYYYLRIIQYVAYFLLSFELHNDITYWSMGTVHGLMTLQFLNYFCLIRVIQWSFIYRCSIVVSSTFRNMKFCANKTPFSLNIFCQRSRRVMNLNARKICLPHRTYILTYGRFMIYERTIFFASHAFGIFLLFFSDPIQRK